MSIFKSLASAGILAFCVVAATGPARAETYATGATATEARAALGASLTALLVAERSGMDAATQVRRAAAKDQAAPATSARAPRDVAKEEGTDFSATPADQADASGPRLVRTGRNALPKSDRFDLGWLMAQPLPKRTAELDCLATALYFEARGEGPTGQAAVAEVILNRTALPGFPGTVCAVVKEGAGDGTGGCQFSFACDGRSDRVTDRASYEIAERIAGLMMAGAPRTLTDGATHFHNDTVRPSWASRFARTARIGEHTFYRMPIRTASN